jgi:hypothetical protein
MGETIMVRYQSGLFVPVHGMTTLERAAREMEIDELSTAPLRKNRVVFVSLFALIVAPCA